MSTVRRGRAGSDTEMGIARARQNLQLAMNSSRTSDAGDVDSAERFAEETARQAIAQPLTLATAGVTLAVAFLNGVVLASWLRALFYACAAGVCALQHYLVRREGRVGGLEVSAPTVPRRGFRVATTLVIALLVSTAGLFALDSEGAAVGADVVADGVATVAFGVDVGAVPFVVSMLISSLGAAAMVPDGIVVAAVWSVYHIIVVFVLRGLDGDAAVVAAAAYTMACAMGAAQVVAIRFLVKRLAAARSAALEGEDLAAALSPETVLRPAQMDASAKAPVVGMLSAKQARTLRDLNSISAASLETPSVHGATVSEGKAGPAGDRVPLRDQGVALLKRIKEVVPAQAGLISYCVSLILASHATEGKQLRLMATNSELMDEDTKRWLSSTLQIRSKGMARHRSSDNIASRFGGSGKRSTSLLPDSSSTQPPRPPHAIEWPPSDDVRAVLDGIMSLEFDIFELATRLPAQRLPYVAYELFDRMDLFAIFDIEAQRFFALMDRVENTYSYDPRSPNPYHDALHAADVAQAVTVFLQEERLQTPLDDLDTMSLMFSAIMHDYRHPGVSNNFLIASKAVIAIRYNDDSVLENFHAASTFMLLAKPEFSIFHELDPDSRRRMRKVIIHCILSTDLAKGGTILENFKTNVVLPVESGEMVVGVDMEQDARMAVMAMTIKCADVGHPIRPFSIHLQWSKMITAEFYAQGDLERQRGMDVSPLCDRHSHNLSKSQLGFIDFVVRPACALLSRYAGHTRWMEQLQANYDEWKSGRVVSDAQEFAAPARAKGFAMRSLGTIMYDDEVDTVPDRSRGASVTSATGQSAYTLPTTSEEGRSVTADPRPTLASPTDPDLGVPVTVHTPAVSPAKPTHRRVPDSAGSVADGSGDTLMRRISTGESLKLAAGRDVELGSSGDHGGKIIMHVPALGGAGSMPPHRHTRRASTGADADAGANEMSVADVKRMAVKLPNLRLNAQDVLMENVETAGRTPVVEQLPEPDSQSDFGFGSVGHRSVGVDSVPEEGALTREKRGSTSVDAEVA